MTRDEHLEWSKKRALECFNRGDLKEAFTSMLCDLSKHPELKNHTGGTIGIGLMLVPGWLSNPTEVRRWIEGFH